MTETTTRILLILATAVISLLSRKYIEPILPERKKAISLIKNFFIFNLRYTLNISLLIYFFITVEFNKYFILIICFYFGIIIFNITSDYVNNYRDKISKLHLDMIEKIATEVNV